MAYTLVKHSWTWADAFDKYGFDSGNSPVQSDKVAEFLEELGYTVTIKTDGKHNPEQIVGLQKDGNILTWSDWNVVKYLPKELMTQLDEKFDENFILSVDY